MRVARTAALGASIVLLLTVSAHGQGEQAHNTLTPAEKAAGWKLLFDGRTTAGWRNFKAQGVDAGWQVQNGALVCVDPKHTTDIITVDRYANFDLSFEWKIAPKGNSGVYYHVLEQGDHGYESGPEYQLLDNAHGEPPPQQAGSLFGLYPPSMDMTKPVGQFNTSRIVVNHGHVEHWMNGMKIVEYQLNSPDFKAHVTGTKFAAWPLFATAPTGYIALQDHDAVVAFRDIKIHPLP